MKISIYCLIISAFLSCNKSVNNSEPLINNNSEVNLVKTTHKNMNTLGLIGGTSWHSTVEYYAAINQSINDYYGNNTNPPLLVYTLNQAEIHRFQKEDKWDSIATMLTEGAISLRKAGAQSVMFCANTPHKMYNDVQAQLDFPIIHIADATAKAIHNKGVKSVGFLGTIYTMEANFITKRIADNGIEVLVPVEKTVLIELQRIIEEELTYGVIKPRSKTYVLKVIQDLVDKGAEGIVLGCTEFPLMVFDKDLNIPVFNTTEIHSMAGVDFILND
ncbi:MULTISPECIES: aspartate/glutamate racemase family protein [unclassified Algibacter]|uniref:aspartate/glutamate racemase family protein n=1 Tax=unclassified Algibacter TaxID=2615009 RepID=UPI00131D3578|nr:MULTISPECIES: amino acid racemase [unclassified Algibacter]MCL5127085.1 amino acid racemase [Algibacter sp. L4_22]